MCGRATLTEPDSRKIAEALEAEASAAVQEWWRPRWNAAPGDLLPVAHQAAAGPRTLDRARWGLPRAGGLLVNLRAESLTPRHGERCVLPVDGFYEWTGPKAARRPRWFHPAQGGLWALAGVLRQTPEGPAFAVLTVPASGLVAEIHDRMPALFPLGGAAGGQGRARLSAWLAGQARPPGPADPALLEAREVSPRVNAVAFDEPACLAPEVPRQASLFP